MKDLHDVALSVAKKKAISLQTLTAKGALQVSCLETFCTFKLKPILAYCIGTYKT
jgi:hypothetical protein